MSLKSWITNMLDSNSGEAFVYMKQAYNDYFSIVVFKINKIERTNTANIKGKFLNLKTRKGYVFLSKALDINEFIETLPIYGTVEYVTDYERNIL